MEYLTFVGISLDVLNLCPLLNQNCFSFGILANETEREAAQLVVSCKYKER